jgi:hypothetical protein
MQTEAQAALDAAKSERQSHLTAGDLADGDVVTALHGRVDAAQSQLAGLNEARAALTTGKTPVNGGGKSSTKFLDPRSCDLLLGDQRRGSIGSLLCFQLDAFLRRAERTYAPEVGTIPRQHRF